MVSELHYLLREAGQLGLDKEKLQAELVKPVVKGGKPFQRVWYRGATEVEPMQGDIRKQLGNTLDATYSYSSGLYWPKHLDNRKHCLIMIDLLKIPEELWYVMSDRHLRFQKIPRAAYATVKGSDLGYELGQRIQNDQRLKQAVVKSLVELVC